MYSVLTAATPLVILTLPAVVIIVLSTPANGISNVVDVTFAIVNEVFNIVPPSSVSVTTSELLSNGAASELVIVTTLDTDSEIVSASYGPTPIEATGTLFAS